MDKIQEMFDEAKQLHAALQKSDEKVIEFLTYMDDLEAKRYRLLALTDALHVAMKEKKRGREIQEQKEHVYWTACEDSDCVYMLTTSAYEYYEEDMEQLEKRYFKEKMEADLGNSSVISKKTKI
ncbi:hypothetical protein [Burkholderia cenocepacia]|uniref:hypothetical protein n=1 Tax=Burkholderia cenocepacia TaxID=95486 RepID=UPI002ABD837C|nr:hypothetical protein [Burkholderia cenocepacia]